MKTSGSITAGVITIPNIDGSANQVLKTDGSGTLSWGTAFDTSQLEIVTVEGGTGTVTATCSGTKKLISGSCSSLKIIRFCMSKCITCAMESLTKLTSLSLASSTCLNA